MEPTYCFELASCACKIDVQFSLACNTDIFDLWIEDLDMIMILLIFVRQDLVDIDVFQEAKIVIDALQNKDVAPALAWCAENKSRLKKSKVCTTVYAFV